jgi:hypothetical protein
MPEIDLLAEYTVERVRTNARAYQQLLRNSPRPADRAPAQDLARQNLRSYLDLQLERLHEWAEGPAWTCSLW